MENTQNERKESVVFLTKDIGPQGLVNIYKALGVPVKGRVAIKMSTGEGSNPNYLKPELIKYSRALLRTCFLGTDGMANLFTPLISPSKRKV